jgi:virginiamycin B lyase
MNARILIRLLACVAVVVLGRLTRPTVMPVLAQDKGILITEYALPPATPHGPFQGPFGITAGPEGAVWFSHSDNLGRITVGGHVTEYRLPTPDPYVGWMHLGPDKAVWFTEQNGNKIGRITADGRVTEYPLSTSTGCFGSPSSVPNGITTGPDGALWFTEQCGNKIGRLTTDGTYAEYPAPGGPVGITTGPDGALWFMAANGSAVGRMTTAGEDIPGRRLRQLYA